MEGNAKWVMFFFWEGKNVLKLYKSGGDTIL
jgi:hypothetical protein